MRRWMIAVTVMAVVAGAYGEATTELTTTSTRPGTSTSEPGTTTTSEPVSSAVLVSDLPRSRPDVAEADLLAVAAGNRAFAADVYTELARRDGNLIFSPSSIRLALAMTYAGAIGDTAAEMASVLHLPFGGDRLHAAMNALDAAIESRNRTEPPDENGVERKVVVNTANALWGQQGYEFLAPFLDTLAANYGAGMRIVDYVTAADAARLLINEWVAQETNDKITDLIDEGVLGPMVRLVLTNAVYLDATWLIPFDEDATMDQPFTRLDGSQVTVPIMHDTLSLPYASGDGWQAVELPYTGGELAMLFVVPDAGRFPAVESAVGEGLLDEILPALRDATVAIGVPKYEFRTKAEVADLLHSLGMVAAFDPQAADFSGMTALERLYISDVIHEAFIAVDEAGTEAAAATAVVMRATSAPMVDVTLDIDRPFLFTLYDRETGTVLFMGRVTDPSA